MRKYVKYISAVNLLMAYGVSIGYILLSSDIISRLPYKQLDEAFITFITPLSLHTCNRFNEPKILVLISEIGLSTLFWSAKWAAKWNT